MRHAREDYERIQDPEGLIPDNEPVFVIRGQDRAAPDTLRAYALKAASLGASDELVNAVRHHAMEMEKWQMEHGSKVPDLPVEHEEVPIV